MVKIDKIYTRGGDGGEKARLPQKLFFCVCRRSDRAEDGALPFRKFPRKLCRGGKGRNNFCIVVTADDKGDAP